MNEPELTPTRPDVVPRSGLTADVIRQLDSAHFRPIAVTFPGEVITDPDGLPIGAEPSTTVTATATVRISRTELTRTRLTQEEVPHVCITD